MMKRPLENGLRGFMLEDRLTEIKNRVGAVSFIKGDAVNNEDGKPKAFKQLDESGNWVIYFNPCLRLDGRYYYSQVSGPIDANEAKAIVKLFLENENA